MQGVRQLPRRLGLLRLPLLPYQQRGTEDDQCQPCFAEADHSAQLVEGRHGVVDRHRISGEQRQPRREAARNEA